MWLWNDVFQVSSEESKDELQNFESGTAKNLYDNRSSTKNYMRFALLELYKNSKI